MGRIWSKRHRDYLIVALAILLAILYMLFSSVTVARLEHNTSRSEYSALKETSSVSGTNSDLVEQGIKDKQNVADNTEVITLSVTDPGLSKSDHNAEQPIISDTNRQDSELPIYKETPDITPVELTPIVKIPPIKIDPKIPPKCGGCGSTISSGLVRCPMSVDTMVYICETLL